MTKSSQKSIILPGRQCCFQTWEPMNVQFLWFCHFVLLFLLCFPFCYCFALPGHHTEGQMCESSCIKRYIYIVLLLLMKRSISNFSLSETRHLIMTLLVSVPAFFVCFLQFSVVFLPFLPIFFPHATQHLMPCVSPLQHRNTEILFWNHSLFCPKEKKHYVDFQQFDRPQETIKVLNICHQNSN